MKKYFLLLLLVSEGVKAQQYFPFPTDSATWGAQFAMYTVDPFNPVVYTDWFYVMDGDTTILNESYHRLKTYIDGVLQFYPIGYLREDSNRRIHFYSTNENEDFIIYDFSLQLGDTVSVPASDFIDQCELKVTNVDSVQVGNQMRRRLTLDEIGFPCSIGQREWVEGIGSVSEGLLYPDIYWVDEAATFTCFSNKDIYYLQACPLNVFVQNLPQESHEFDLIPNPANKKFTIRSSFPVQRINIYNEFGSLIKTNQSHRDETGIEDLQTGCYLVEVIYQDHTVARKKLMVE